MTARPDFDVQGHRGARGLWPENTLRSFFAAFDYGLPTVELDVVMSGDGQVIVSHEPWFSHEYCSHPDGQPVEEAQAHTLRLLDRSAEDIARFDCGSRGHPRFPEQRPSAAYKPTLSEVIVSCDATCAQRGLAAPRYNVEVKARPDWDGVFTPPPPQFAAAVAEVVAGHGALQRATLQSFDWRVLEAWHAAGVRADLALLVENGWSVESNLSALSFVPHGYHPDHGLVDAALVAKVHALGMRLVTWTVNEAADMRRLRSLGVDGIITDYPDRAAREFGLAIAASPPA